MARDRGASKVFMTDVSGERLKIALDAIGTSIDDAWVAGEDNGVEEVLSRTGGHGAERVSVAAPAKPAQQAALEMAAKRAVVVYFAGLPKHDPVSPLDMNQLHYKELEIRGAYGATHRQYRITMDYLDRKQDELAAVVTHRWPLDRIGGGVRDDPRRHRAEDGDRAVTGGPYVLGCDVGSQGTNVALYAADGTLVASSYQTYDLVLPVPGRRRAGRRRVGARDRGGRARAARARSRRDRRR